MTVIMIDGTDWIPQPDAARIANTSPEALASRKRREAGHPRTRMWRGHLLYRLEDTRAYAESWTDNRRAPTMGGAL